ncbi:MAG: outer membrane beta-barrel protein [Planctomycetota bacterium]
MSYPQAEASSSPLAPLLLLVLCVAAPLRAQQSSFDDFRNLGQLEERRREPSPLRVGPHELEPSLNVKLLDAVTPHVFGALSAGYNDNLLRIDRERVGVHVVGQPEVEAEAGARLDAELGDHRLELEYRAKAVEYLNTGRYDTQQQSVRLRADVYAVDLELHGDASWQRFAYPQSIQLTGLVDLDQFQASAWADGRLGRFGLRAGGYWAFLDFRQRGLDRLDQYHYRGDVQTYFRATPKLRVLLEYNYLVVEYINGRKGGLNDYVAHQVRGGVDGELSPKLTASVKLGYNKQDVDKRAFLDRREFEGFVAEVGAGYQPFAETHIQAGYSRTLESSIQGNFLGSDQVFVAVQQGLFSTITVSARARYTHSDVSRTGRTLGHLNRFETGAGVSYRPRGWISFSLDYGFTRLGSTFPDSDYEVHEVTASVGVGL